MCKYITNKRGANRSTSFNFYLVLISCFSIYTSFSQFRNTKSVDNISNYSTNFKEYEIKLEDDYIIKSKVIFSQSESDKFLFILSGDNGNMTYLYQTANIISENLNINVILYDYRGGGINEPFDYGDITISSLNVNDFNYIINFYRTQFVDSQFYVLGISLGGIIALNSILNENINAVCIDSSPINYQKFLLDKSIKSDTRFFNDYKKLLTSYSDKKIFIFYSLLDKMVDKQYVILNDYIERNNLTYIIFNNSSHANLIPNNTKLYLNSLYNLIN